MIMLLIVRSYVVDPGLEPLFGHRPPSSDDGPAPLGHSYNVGDRLLRVALDRHIPKSRPLAGINSEVDIKLFDSRFHIFRMGNRGAVQSVGPQPFQDIVGGL